MLYIHDEDDDVNKIRFLTSIFCFLVCSENIVYRILAQVV